MIDDFTFKDFVSSRTLPIGDTISVEITFQKNNQISYVLVSQILYKEWLRKFIP